MDQLNVVRPEVEFAKYKRWLEFEMEQAAVELQHVNVKLLVKDAEKVDIQAAVPVFHKWIQAQIFDELLLDVADYSHVPDGPGVVLIGHDADYALDNTNGRLGVRYNRKAPLSGTNRDRLDHATRSALRAFERLAQDLKLNFNGREIEVVINDRLLAPNNPDTRTAIEPEFEDLFGRLFAGSHFVLTHPSEPRRLFGVIAKAEQEFSLNSLLANLS
jgi:hypothetical protein